MTRVDDLTPQQSNVLADLLAGETVSATARNHCVHRSTIHNWIRDDLRFRAALDQGRARLQTALYDQVQELAAEALDRIRHILGDPNASPSVQLRAAALILKMAQTSCPPSSALPSDPLPAEQNEAEVRQTSTPFRYASPPPGRNQPCPCNSGRKYKHCCLDKARHGAPDRDAS